MVVACAGKRHLIKGDWIKEGTIVIDAGVNSSISTLDSHKIVGDVEYRKVKFNHEFRQFKERVSSHQFQEESAQ